MRRTTVTRLFPLLLTALAAVAQSAPPAPTPVPTDAEIRKILADRIDTQHQGVGIVVGVVEPQGRRVIAYGKFDKDDPRVLDGNTVFEIGSITKVFTSLLLADMVQRGEVTLDDPVAKYLPEGTKVPERAGHKIALIDLSTHTSGLPRMPDNFHPKDPSNPYADYTVEQMYQFLSTCQLSHDIGTHFDYSNLGGGLLGHALARRAGMDYEGLVRARIATPLGMKSTVIALSPDLKARLAVGHNAQLAVAANWDLPTLAGAGALRSTANDMLNFLAANLGAVKTPLAPAMAAMLKVRRLTGTPELGDIALGWLVRKSADEELVWHNGGTGGYRSFAGYNAKTGVGVVVLSNTSTPAGVDDIGRHLLDTRLPLIAPPKEHKPVAIDAKLLDGYIGQYQLAPNFILTVTRELDQLFVQATGQPKFPVYPEGDRDFFLKVVDAQLTFDVDASGKASSVTLHQNGANVPAKRIQ